MQPWILVPLCYETEKKDEGSILYSGVQRMNEQFHLLREEAAS